MGQGWDSGDYNAKRHCARIPSVRNCEGGNVADDKVLCPNCGSAQIHAEERGWTITTGMIGSRKIFITCMKCGRKFKPGQGIDAVEHAVSDAA